MIIYCTKEMRERYNLESIEKMTTPLKEINQAVLDKENGDKLFEWGAKLFYFDRKKCLQVVNFASKFTLFLIDIKVKDISAVPNFMFMYIEDIYKDDKLMLNCLKKMPEEYPFCVFSKLTNGSIISTLNNTEMSFLDYGYRLYEYIENGILHTKKINEEINKDWIFSCKNGKDKEYFYSANKFRELVVARYNK